MNVVDSSAWLAWFVDEPGAEQFVAAIEETEFLVVPAICLHEVFRFVLRNRGEDAALEAVSLMQRGTVLDLDASLAIDSAQVGLSEGLALADAIIYATTLKVEGTLWTRDGHFAGKPHVQYVPKSVGT